MSAAVSPDILPTQEDHDHHDQPWVTKVTFSLLLVGLLVSQTVVVFAVQKEWYLLAVPFVLIASHFMHGLLVGFHEASHSLLRKNRLLNDLDGMLIGTLSFMSFTLYRAAHQTHHMHLATERDEELWPFVNVGTPRWQRRLAAFIELNLGLAFTPFLFARIFLRKGSPIRNKKVRRRVWMEFAIIVVVNALIIASVTWFGVWKLFLWSYVAPAIIGGNMQSWRKYIEHVGLTGHTARSATRSIICNTWTGKLISFTLLHEPYHGVHHLKAGLHWGELPANAGLLQPEQEGELPPFPNYRSAIMHLLRNLWDPKSGSHWPAEPAAQKA